MVNLDDVFPSWNCVFQLANAMITDRDCLPFWHGLIKLHDQERAQRKATAPYRRQINVHPTRLLSAQDRVRTLKVLRVYRNEVRVHGKADLFPEGGTAGATSYAALPSTHPDFRTGKRRYLGFINGRVVGRRLPFAHVQIERNSSTDKGHWTKQSVSELRATIVFIAVTVSHEMSHALETLITQDMSKHEPYVNDACHSEIGHALESFLLGGVLERFKEHDHLCIHTWPNVYTLEQYNDGGGGIECRGFLMPDKMDGPIYPIEPEECARFLSAKMWTSSPQDRKKIQRTPREERFDVMCHVRSAREMDAEELEEGVDPRMCYPEESSDGASEDGDDNNDAGSVGEQAQEADAPASSDADDEPDESDRRHVPQYDDPIMAEAAAAHPFNFRVFRLKKMRLIPYREMPECEDEFNMYFDPELENCGQGRNKKLRASAELEKQLKDNQVARLKAALVTSSRTRRLELRRKTQMGRKLTTLRTVLDRFWRDVLRGKTFTLDRPHSSEHGK